MIKQLPRIDTNPNSILGATWTALKIMYLLMILNLDLDLDLEGSLFSPLLIS
jgi:hypothetical protein